MPLSLDHIQSLRQEYVGVFDRLIRDATAEPGYDLAAVDAWTQERWRIAGASERQGYLVAVAS